MTRNFISARWRKIARVRLHDGISTRYATKSFFSEISEIYDRLRRSLVAVGLCIARLFESLGLPNKPATNVPSWTRQSSQLALVLVSVGLPVFEFEQNQK